RFLSSRMTKKKCGAIVVSQQRRQQPQCLNATHRGKPISGRSSSCLSPRLKLKLKSQNEPSFTASERRQITAPAVQSAAESSRVESMSIVISCSSSDHPEWSALSARPRSPWLFNFCRCLHSNFDNSILHYLIYTPNLLDPSLFLHSGSPFV